MKKKFFFIPVLLFYPIENFTLIILVVLRGRHDSWIMSYSWLKNGQNGRWLAKIWVSTLGRRGIPSWLICNQNQVDTTSLSRVMAEKPKKNPTPRGIRVLYMGGPKKNRFWGYRLKRRVLTRWVQKSWSEHWNRYGSWVMGDLVR